MRRMCGLMLGNGKRAVMQCAIVDDAMRGDSKRMSAVHKGEADQLPSLMERSGKTFDVLNARVLSGFVHLCLARGGDPIALLADVGICVQEGDQPVSAITYRQFMQLLSNAATVLNCPDFGMCLAFEQAGTELYGPLGSVMRHSRTFGAALNYVTRHSSIHSGAARISKFVSANARDIAFSHEIMVGAFEEQVQAIEYVLLAGHLGARALTNGQVKGRTALFRHQAISPLAVYHRYFRCEVEFDRQINGLIFSPTDLAASIVDSNPTLHADLVETVKASFSASAPPLHATVRGLVLRQMLTGGATNDVVAAELGLHTRTLHRRLAEAGTSFQKIKDEVRCELTRYYLARTDVSFLWITAKLGFAEQAVFTRFCQRQFGCSPRALRRQSREEKLLSHCNT